MTAPPQARPSAFWLALAATALVGSSGVRATAADSVPPTAERLDFFERRVRPLLVEHCYACHSVDADRIEGNLWLDSRQGHLDGGDSGAAIVPGDAAASPLLEAVRYESYEMPPKGKLPDEAIRVFERWIEQGAAWPDEPPPSVRTERPVFDLDQRKAEHWAWQPITRPDVPSVSDASWPASDLDRFILAKLDEAGLQPAADADRAALLRRLSFDLVGLPPTPEQVDALLADPRGDDEAIAAVVDDLLASPHFGERWTRHWLDLVRYAESRGHEFDNDTPNAFQYRDYVIRAFNTDVPYDQFVREHIAGDLLPSPRRHPAAGFSESVLGTGFWHLGEWVHSPVDVRKDESDRFDNMIDVMSKAFLGLTVSCARCHDHKFDAISTADYYALSGYLQSSDYRQVRFESIEQNRTLAAELAATDRSYRDRLASLLADRGLTPPPDPPDPPDPNDAIVVDYRTIGPDDFLTDGFLFGPGPRQAGASFVGEAGRVRMATATAAASDPIWHGLKSITAGSVHDRNRLAKLPASGRTLRTPTFELTDGVVHCRVDGAGHVVACVDSHRLVAGPLHGQTIAEILPGQPWTTLKLHRYVGHRMHLEFVPAEQATLAVQLVAQGLSPAERDALGRRLEDRRAPFAAFAAAAEAVLASDAGAAALAEDWTAARAAIAARIVRTSHLAPAMRDGTGEDDRVLIRGNSSTPGVVQPRRFLTAIAGNAPPPTDAGSGRLHLAAWINDARNPLPARVIVNRVWHHLIGRGLVPTVDDFGVLGERPSHPELLDHLAAGFRDDGQSLKRLIRRIALSRTYRMASQADPHAAAVDPNNTLWHHRPPRRLQGEAIRDALLAVSGRLDRTPFGPPVPIHLTPFMDGRGRPKASGPRDGDGRRTIYVAVRRNFLSPLLLAFDTPAPFSAMGRRNVSNVPAQALILLNDPLVAELAGDWGRRAVKTVPGADAAATAERVRERIAWLYRTGFARSPTATEIEAAARFVSDQAERRGGTPDDPAVWGELAHALVNVKEFVFLQ